MKKAALSLLATALFAFAQRPPGPPPPPSFANVKSALALTDATITQLHDLQHNRVRDEQALAQQMPALQTNLQNLLKAPAPNPTTVGHALIQVENLHKQLTALHQSYTDKALALLSFDQKSKLADLQKAQKLQNPIHEAAMLDLLAPDAQGPDAGMRPAMGGPQPLQRPGPPPPPQQ